MIIIAFFPSSLLSQERIKVEKIFFEGIQKISSKALKRVIGFKEGDLIRKGEILLAVQRIEGFYHSKGFLDAKVISQRLLERKGKYYVYYYIYEGSQKIIKTIEIEGARWDFIKNLNIPSVPRVYSETVLGNFEIYLYSLYRKNGYPFFDLKKEIFPVGGDSIIIIYTLKEGKKSKIDDIKVEGLKRTRKKIVLREVEIKSGEYFNIEKIINSISNIYSTGLFSNVEYKIIPQKDSNYVTLLFSLNERKERAFDMGVGYSSEGDFQTRLSFSHLNIFGNGQRFFLETNVLQNLKFTRHFEANATYLEPFLFGHRLPLSLALFYYKDRDEEIMRKGLESQIKKNITRFFDISTKITLQQVKGKRDKYSTYLNSLSLFFIFDDRNDLIDPDRGIFFLFSPSQSGWILGGDADIRKILFDLSFFNPVRIFLIASRIRGGAVLSYGRTEEVPVSEKFLMGGEGSVRGVGRFSIGETDPRGIKSGNYFLNINLELRFKYLPFKLYPVIFFDSGILKNNPEDINFKSFVNTGGLGLRVRFFHIIFRADAGYKLKNINLFKGYFYLGLGHMF